MLGLQLVSCASEPCFRTHFALNPTLWGKQKMQGITELATRNYCLRNLCPNSLPKSITFKMANH